MKRRLLIFLISAIGYGYILPVNAQAPGNSLEFAGTEITQNALFVPNGGSHPLDITGSITIETWIKPTRKTTLDEANKWNTILMKGSYGYGLVIGDDNCQASAVGKLGYWGQNGCGSVPFSTIPIEYGKWNHVAVVISSGNLTFYINGEAAGTATGISIPNGGAGTSLYIGAQDRMSGGNGWYKGTMDEVRIWNIARTANEVKTNMYKEIDPSSAGLVTYFRFDQGTAGGDNTAITTADDLSANNLDATLSNFTLSGNASNFVESYAMVVPKVAVASNVSSTGFTANWQAAEVGTVTNYLLDVAADKTFNTFITGYNGLNVGTGTSYSVTGLSGYNGYYYRLRADKTSVTGTAAKSAGMLVSVPVAGLGKATSFERSRSEGIQVAHHSSFNFGTGSYTIESWIKRPAGSGFFTIVGKQTGAADGMFLRFNDNIISFAAGQYPASTDVSSVSAISDNNWHHIAAVRDASDKTMKIYIDGVLDASRTFSTLYTANTSAALGIGFKPNYGEYFDGSMDEVRIWNTARTASQIKEYMSAPLSGTESGLVAYWNFEEGTGTSVDDLSSNINTGTLQNSDGDEWPDGGITYTRTTDEDNTFTFRLGGSDLASQPAATAFISQLPANGKIYHTNDGTTKGAEITSMGISLTDPGGNPRRMIYEPSPNFNGTDVFKYQVNNGVTNSANTETVNITISAVNDAPVITSNGGAATASVTLQENTTAVTTVTATDAEAATINYSIAGGADQSRFSINSSNGVLIFASAPDFEVPADADLNNTYVVVVQAGDGMAATAQTITVTVSNTDDTAPAVPTGLSAISDDTQITLNWTPNAEGDLNGYKLYGGTSSNPTALLQTIAAPATTYTVSGLTNGTTYYYRISAIDNTGNESSVGADVSTVPKAGQTVSFNTLAAKTYGDNSFTLSATASSGLSVSYSSSDPAVASVSGNTVTIIKAGSTIITATQAGNSSFNAAPDVLQTLLVNIKAITATAAAQSKTYGDVEPALTYTFSPALISGDSFSGALSRAAGENIGSYTIGQGSLALSSNYALTFQAADLTITTKSVTVTAAAKTKTYGDADPAFTYTFSPALINGDSFSGALFRAAGENTGTYTIGQGSLALSSNYSLSFQTADLSIIAKAITVTADNVTKMKGIELSDVTGSIAFSTVGLAGSETIGSVNIRYGSGASAEAESGSYPGDVIPGNAAGGTFMPANYAITYVPGNLLVMPIPPSLTVSASLTSFITCAGNASLQQSITVAGNNLTGNIILTAPAGFEISLSSAGTYTNSLTLTASAGTLSNTAVYIRISGAATGTISGSLIIGSNDVTPETISLSGIASVIAVPVISAGGPLSFCSGERVLLTSSASEGNQWYRDGIIIAGATSQIYQATSSGSYTAIVTNSYACSVSSASAVVTVNPLPLASITNGFLVSLNTSGTVTLTANTEAGYQWYKDGALLNGQTNNKLNVTQPGSYTLQTTNTSGCSSMSSTTEVLALPSPAVSGVTSFCEGGSVIISIGLEPGQTFIRWRDADNNTVGTNITYTATTTGEYSAEVRTGAVIQSTKAVSVIVNPLPDAKISSTAGSICAGESLTLNASGGSTYQWFLDGNAISGATGASYQATASGSYTLRATNATGCFSVSTATMITVNPLPGIIPAPIPAVSTLDNSFTIPYLSATGNADQYSLRGISPMSGFADVVNAPLLNSPIRVSIPASTAGTYTFNLTVSNSNTGCSSAPVPITLKINLTTQAIAFSFITKRTYGDADIDPEATVSSGLPVNYSSSNPAVASIVSGKVHILSAGSTIITAAQPGNAVYSAATPVSRILVIDKKPLTVKADDKVKLQGTANPQLTISYSGFVNGENEMILTALPVAAATATVSSSGGTYPITVSGGAAASYSFNYVNGQLTVGRAAPTAISLAAETLFENQPSGTKTGILSSISDDPHAVFTYSLVNGSGDTDNSLFTISGNELRTSATFNYEQKAAYSILVRSTTEYGMSLDKQFTISISDVNEAPTLDPVDVTAFCFTNSERTQTLTGISPGPETGQVASISVSSTNANLFDQLTVSNVSGANAILTYRFKASGSAAVTLTVTDNGERSNGGINTFSRTFTITANAVPQVAVNSNIGTNISKGDEAVLTATGGTLYHWSNASGIIAGQDSGTLTVRPAQTTTYSVMVTNGSGCGVSQSITINVAEDYKLDANNILSVNGDGKNDNLVIKNIDMYPNNEVKIFDRAGRLIYSKKNYTNDWNGTFQNSPLAEDTYFYVVDFGPAHGRIRGYVTIIRNQ